VSLPALPVNPIIEIQREFTGLTVTLTCDFICRFIGNKRLQRS
jgi:hypothetical protein